MEHLSQRVAKGSQAKTQELPSSLFYFMIYAKNAPEMSNNYKHYW